MERNWRSRLQQALTGRVAEDRRDPDDREEGEQDDAPAMETRQVPTAAITGNPHQPRTEVDDAALNDLAESISLHGLLQPIIVRRLAAGYELVAGQRRLLAARKLGLQTLPAVVMEVSDEDTGLLALVENLQREGLGFMEEAAAYERLLKDFNLTQEELARRLGKSQSTVANKLRLLRLAPEVRERVGGARFSERHARALLALKDTQHQLRVCDAIQAKGLTVRQAEAMVERLRAEELAEGVGRRKMGQNWRTVFRDARILSNTFRAAVRRLQRSGMEAEMEEIERDEGIEIKVLVRLPAGWREGPRQGRKDTPKGRRSAAVEPIASQKR